MTEIVGFLNGARYGTEYSIGENITLHKLPDFEDDKFATKTLPALINEHMTRYVPRYAKLRRYSRGDNDIKFKPKKVNDQPDLRIAHPIASEIVDFHTGYMFKEPISYNNADNSITDIINDSFKETNEPDHNVTLKTTQSTYGTAYELISQKGDIQTLDTLSPMTTFVVYDNLTDPSSLFAVRYFTSAGEMIAEVYTYDKIYTFYADDEALGFTGTFSRDEHVDEHMFEGVPITEFPNDSNKFGDFEKSMDLIDFMDSAVSEQANWMALMNSPKIVAKDIVPYLPGAPVASSNDDDDIKKAASQKSKLLNKSMTEAKMIAFQSRTVGDPKSPTVIPGDISILQTASDNPGVEEILKRLNREILRYSHVLDSHDERFSGARSGTSMEYIMIGINSRVSQQRSLFTKGIMRRLRLMANAWSIKYGKDISYDAINETTVRYHSGDPKNVADLVLLIKNSVENDAMSIKTATDLLEAVTGVPSVEELTRLAEEAEARRKAAANDVTGDETPHE